MCAMQTKRWNIPAHILWMHDIQKDMEFNSGLAWYEEKHGNCNNNTESIQTTYRGNSTLAKMRCSALAGCILPRVECKKQGNFWKWKNRYGDYMLQNQVHYFSMHNRFGRLCLNYTLNMVLWCSFLRLLLSPVYFYQFNEIYFIKK